MLRKFLKVYTWVVLALTAIVAAGAIYAWVTGQMLKAYYFAFTGLLFVFMWFVTRWFVKRNLPQ